MHQLKIYARIKAFGYVGILATGVGLTFYLRKRQKHKLIDKVLAESTEDSKLPGPSLNLELKQVQVIFRHGARTPLYVLEGYRQVPYYSDLHLRPHQHTLFPYERVSRDTLQPVDWSEYEYNLRSKELLRGGVIPGYLTSIGQEQMYSLGLRIREMYRDQLSLEMFSPDTTYLLCTNIARTVESARCVLAGVFGKENLTKYAAQYGPVKMHMVEKDLNILIPDTGTCPVLRHVNHASMLHFDYIPSMKRNRETIEKHIDEQHDNHQTALAKAQEKLNAYFATSSSKQESCSISFNSDRQPFNYDPVLLQLLHDRDLAIDEVDKFWQNVLSNHPHFAGRLSKEERQALAYLRKIDVEEFNLKFSSGIRFKFHFDQNPYFHNTTLCKEIVHLPTNSNGGSSKTTQIKWKDGKNLYQQHKSKHPINDASSANVSFFCWYLDPVHIEQNTIGHIIKDEIWKNPLDFYQHVSYAMDHSVTKKINFVFLRDDMVARESHGWLYPKDILQFKGIPERNATRMIYYAMTGRHHAERQVVTRLSTGRLLKDMLERMETLLAGTSKSRLILYSGHDTTMVALLESLGIWDKQWPPFGSDVILEIYQDKNSGQQYVKVLYNGQEKKVRGQTDFLMKKSDFLTAIKPYVIDQETFDTICASSFLEEVAKDVLVHEEGEKQEDEESVKTSETPAGM